MIPQEVLSLLGILLVLVLVLGGCYAFTRWAGTGLAGRFGVSPAGRQLRVLERLLNEDRLVAMSTGYIEGDRVTIVDGPLEGLETVIRKIDRHKRTALVEMHMFGRVQEVAVGLEVVGRV